MRCFLLQRVGAEQGHEFVREDGGRDFDLLDGFLELVDVLLELLELRLADGEFGGTDEILFGIGEEVEPEEGVEEFEGAAFVGAGVVVERLVCDGGFGGAVAETLEGIANVFVMVVWEW